MSVSLTVLLTAVSGVSFMWARRIVISYSLYALDDLVLKLGLLPPAHGQPNSRRCESFNTHELFKLTEVQSGTRLKPSADLSLSLQVLNKNC